VEAANFTAFIFPAGSYTLQPHVDVGISEYSGSGKMFIINRFWGKGEIN
jgi:hypothetical protein